MNTTAHTEIEDYLGQLRHELADLPPDEVDEIVQDLEPQLAEIAECNGTLTDRLGTPAEYARELRTAAGLGEPAPHRPSVWLPRTLLWALVISTVVACYGGYVNGLISSNDARYVLPFFGLFLIACGVVLRRRQPAMSEVAALPEVRLVAALPARLARGRDVIGYLMSLRPAWFLVRAGLVWLGLVWVFRLYGLWDAWPEVVAFGCAVVTMVAGYRSMKDRRWLWLSAPLGGWAVGVALALVNYGEIWSPLLAGDYIGY